MEICDNTDPSLTATQIRRRSRSNKCCCVHGCNSRTQLGKISLHFFPKDAVLRETWKQKLKMSKEITDSMCVCSLHFSTSSYFPLYPGMQSDKPRLKKGSVPSENLPRTYRQNVISRSSIVARLKSRESRAPKRQAHVLDEPHESRRPTPSKMVKTDWTCIVSTCHQSKWIEILEKELLLLQKKDCIPSGTALLTIKDPSKHIGSGATLLNALVVATEYLSAASGYNTINADVLQSASILVLSHGRDYVFDTGGKPFVHLPKQSNGDVLYESVTSLENSLRVLSHLRTKTPGIWICSTDMFLSCDLNKLPCPDVSGNDAILFSVQASVDYAKNHGCVVLGRDNTVEDILYCASADVLLPHSNHNKVPIVAGIVYLSPNVAESLLSLHSSTPLESCTYLGIDSGFSALPMSLYFDFLMAMVPNLSEDDFLLGKHCKLYNERNKLRQDQSSGMVLARKVIRENLSKFRLRCLSLKDAKHIYWDDKLTLHDHICNVLSNGTEYQNRRPVAINSVVEESDRCVIGSGSVICHSVFVPGKETVRIGDGCYVSNISFSATESVGLHVPDSMAAISYHIRMEEGLKEKCVVMMGVHDHVWLPMSDPQSTYCNVSWEDFFTRTGHSPDDIWDCTSNLEDRNLWNAKLFLVSSRIEDYGWFFGIAERPESWDNGVKMSLSEILRRSDPGADFERRREVHALKSCHYVATRISKNSDCSFLSHIGASCLEGWSTQLLHTLDAAAVENYDNRATLSRILSCTADLLGTMAGKLGQIRSGPGSNKLWNAAFESFASGDTLKALATLTETRNRWLKRSDLLVRAARHYDRAVQILISSAVMTSKQFITHVDCGLPEMGHWIQAECPGRVDLQGGWTDTPPICYEHGGSVVNMAITLDGVRPLGAKARRIPEKHLVFVLGQDNLASRMEIDNISGLQDYNQPCAAGALLKAALVCAEIVDVNSTENLQSQLNKYGSGFEVHIWSILPHGSGLGTSSILAGAVIAVLWTVSGRSFSRDSLLHAVLYLEQLLTTGGGWQDQVGGIMGGINRGFSSASLPLQIHVEKLPLTDHFLSVLDEHFLLLYTGKVRLAKNLLQNVIRNWYAKEEKVVQCFKNLFKSSLSLVAAFEKCNLKSIGEHMNSYWEMKKVLAPGCEPAVVRKLMQTLDELAFGQVLAGAGGGGFLCILTKKPNAIEDVKNILQKSRDFDDVTVHRVSIDMEGINIF